MLDRRLLPALAVSITPVVLVLWFQAFGLGGQAWMGTFEWTVSFGLLVLAFVTAVATCARVRWLGIAIPAALLAANTVSVVAMLLGKPLIPTHGFASDKYAVVLSSGMVLGIAGLALRRQWARWLALALGATGLGCGVLNAINYWSECTVLTEYGAAWQAEACHSTWVHLVTATGGALILVNLVATRATFRGAAVWDRPEPFVRWLRLATIASFVAVPMLLVYAWLQPVVPATANTALALAGTLAIGAALAIRGKLAGALLLVAGGLGLAAQTIVTVVAAEPPRVAFYYAVFWLPAAVIAIVCGVVMVRPMLRLVRD